MADIIQTLQLKDDPTTKVFPRIKSDGIPSGAVTTGKIGDFAITTIKVADGAITTAKLSNNAVSTSNIQGSAVVAGKIADGAITEGKIDNGAVTRTKIANNAVNKGKMAVYTSNWLLYLRQPSNTNEFLQAVFQDYVNELQTNTLIELNMYSYNGNVYSPIKIYYDLTSTAVYVYELNDTGWELTTIDSQTQWANVYQMLNDIYLTYLL